MKENFRLRADQDHKPPSQDYWKSGAWYDADGISARPSGCAGGAGKLRSSIHMPRWASRITLEIIEVRAERLQRISSADCFAEGIDPETDETYLAAEHAQLGGVQIRGGSAERCAYASLWESINGKGSWDANPWVWVVSFRKLSP